MRIFVSHSHQQRTAADDLASRLRVEGHRAFLDRDQLPRGEGYDRRIREEIGACDLFLFLISPASVGAGSYALTELELARKQWPNAAGRVLPVVVEFTPENDIPSYLRAVGILTPSGDMVAEVLAEVATHALRRHRRRLLLAIGLGAPAMLASGLVLRQRYQRTTARGATAPRTSDQQPRNRDSKPDTPPVRKQTAPGLRPATPGEQSSSRPSRNSGFPEKTRPRPSVIRTTGDDATDLPALPNAADLERHFPGTRICRPWAEADAAESDTLWLVCRCPDAISPGSNGLRLRKGGWRSDRWAYAARMADTASWRCP
jgi:hypothetical protein